MRLILDPRQTATLRVFFFLEQHSDYAKLNRGGWARAMVARFLPAPDHNGRPLICCILLVSADLT